MSKVRAVLRYFISFFLMFTIIIMQLSFFVNIKVLNGDFYKKTLSGSDYFSLMRKDIDYGFKNLSMITSIPEETFTSSVNDETIKELTYKNISSAANYMTYKDNYYNDKIDNKLIYNNIEKYALKNNMKVEGNLKNQLLDVSEDAGKIINNYAVLFNIGAVDNYSQFQSFRKLLYLLYSIKIMSVIAVLFMIALLGVLNIKSPRRTFLWIGSSFIPAAIITLIPCILAIYYKVPSRFAVDNPYLKVALKDISLGYIKYFTITGILVLLTGILCMCLYTYLSNKGYSKYEEMRKKIA